MLENPPTKWTLVERVRNGDPGALAELFHAYAHAVHGVAFKITGSAHDADDVLQDVFVALPEALSTYREQGDFRKWIKGIAVRRSLMALRQTKHRREVSLSGIGYVPAEPEQPLVERVALERAMSQLPAQLRAVFVLKEVEGYTHEEIGEMLDISAHASAHKLSRARESLRKLLRSSA